MSFEFKCYSMSAIQHIYCCVVCSQINIFNSIELMLFHDADTPHGYSDMIAAHRF